MNKIYLFLSFLAFSACMTSQKNAQPSHFSDQNYSDLIEQFSDHFQKYDGPYNIFQVQATFINSKIAAAQVLRQSKTFQWDQTKQQAELNFKKTTNSEKTEIFVSFYAPDKKMSDLMRTETLWATILKTGGGEFVGKPKKLNLLPMEIQNLYPQHNQWSTGYLITFDVAASTIEDKINHLVITGPAGVATLTFKSILDEPTAK